MKTSALTHKRNRSVSTSLEKSLSRYALATASLAAVAIPSAAKADPADFSGPYAPANWTFTNTGGSTDGSVNTAGAPVSISLTGGNSGSGTSGTTNFTIAAVASGMVSFDWNYTSADTGSYDIGNFLLNGTPTFLANNNGGSGTFTIAVNAGDIFGFQVFSQDNSFGAGTLTVANFSAPVPEGSTLALFALGSVGILILMRRRTQASD
jgi:hypothetical protein